MRPSIGGWIGPSVLMARFGGTGEGRAAYLVIIATRASRMIAEIWASFAFSIFRCVASLS